MPEFSTRQGVTRLKNTSPGVGLPMLCRPFYRKWHNENSNIRGKMLSGSALDERIAFRRGHASSLRD
jgi:hypothetical protein